jgi:serine phosphatase RsbU (regulator of sigma subunit)/pSer/pThr/pTyr-binding forkhead associated (FHA) protein
MSDATLPRLVVTDSLGRRLIPVDKAVVTLGRRSDNDVRVTDAGVSRRHAEIHVGPDGCRIQDCSSRFGTFVNGERRADHVLTHGDRIRLGQSADTDIVFVVGDADELPSQAKSVVAAASELRNLAGLLEGLRALGSGRVLDDVLTLVLDAAIDVTGAERAFIMLAQARQALEFTRGRGRGRVTLSGQTFATSRKIPDTVFATGQPLIVEDLLDTELAAAHTGTVAIGIRHVLCTPLRLVRYVERVEDRTEDQRIGVLYLDSRERGALGSASTRSALETLSTEAAAAIENARLYREALERAKLEQELQMAAGIQQALLPIGDVTGGFFTIAGTSIACRSVGGDFFDYLDRPGGPFGFMLGDVAGKGSPAALLAAAVLGMFSAEAEYHTSPGALMARLNGGLLRRHIEARFVTAFYGVLAPDGSLTYSNAGHNPPMLVTADGVRRLDAGGLVLGLFAHGAFDEETLTLQPGDAVVVFSDGVTEAFDEAGGEFTDERLLAAVTTHRGQAPRVWLDALLAEVRAFCGRATPSDDLTILVIRYEGRPREGAGA